MCNKLHNDSVPIRKKGKGWKLFEKGNRRGLLLPIAIHYNTVPYSIGKTYIWDNKICGNFVDNNEWGFCFFLNKKEAKRCLKNWDDPNIIILQIEYNQGLGKHFETQLTGFNTSYKIALSKEFKIIEGQRY